MDALDAYDGVEISLLGGNVVRVPAFTVAEAGHYLRMLDVLAGDNEEAKAATVEALVAEFAERMALVDVPLAELAFRVEGVEFGAMTVARALDIVRLLGTASWGEPMERSKAQVRWLDEAPILFGVSDDMRPADLFELGQRFASEFYLHLYGLAQDFCSRLATGPEAMTWAITALPEPSSVAGTPT